MLLVLYIYIHRDVGTKWIENLTNWHTKESLLRPNKRSQPNGYQISKILRVIIYSDLSRLSCWIDSIYNQTFNSSKQLFFELNSSTHSFRRDYYYKNFSYKSSLFENSVRLIKRPDKRSHRSSIGRSYRGIATTQG